MDYQRECFFFLLSQRPLFRKVFTCWINCIYAITPSLFTHQHLLDSFGLEWETQCYQNKLFKVWPKAKIFDILGIRCFQFIFLIVESLHNSSGFRHFWFQVHCRGVHWSTLEEALSWSVRGPVDQPPSPWPLNTSFAFLAGLSIVLGTLHTLFLI